MRYITSLILALVAITAHAQEPRPVYCEMMAYQAGLFSTKSIITLDIGEQRNGTIVDDEGQAVRFASNVAALNYLSRLGWSVKDTYFVSEGKNTQVIRYLLEKFITSDEQLTEGIHIKPTKAPEKKQYDPEKYD